MNCRSLEIRSMSLLLPAGKTVDVLNFLQFKVTIPKDKYRVIMSPMSQCDFVFKMKRVEAVPKPHFLSKRTLCTSCWRLLLFYFIGGVASGPIFELIWFVNLKVQLFFRTDHVPVSLTMWWPVLISGILLVLI